MTRLLLLCCVIALPARAEDAYTALCRSNPAYSPSVMRAVVGEQMQRDHDAALDDAPPDQLAQEAVEQGVKDCAGDLSADPVLFGTLIGLPAADRPIGWDAYNSACSNRPAGSKGNCVKAEFDSQRAIKIMVGLNRPPGAREIAQTCALVLKTNPPMVAWRECIDAGLAVHAAPAAVKRCKLSVNWHSTADGAVAGRSVAGCLARG